MKSKPSKFFQQVGQVKPAGVKIAESKASSSIRRGFCDTKYEESYPELVADYYRTFIVHTSLEKQSRPREPQSYLKWLENSYFMHYNEFLLEAIKGNYPDQPAGFLWPHEQVEKIISQLQLRKKQRLFDSFVLLDWDNTLFLDSSSRSQKERQKTKISRLLVSLSAVGIVPIICTARTPIVGEVPFSGLIQSLSNVHIIYTANSVPKEFFRLTLQEALGVPGILVDDLFHEVNFVFDEKRTIHVLEPQAGDTSWIKNKILNKLNKGHIIFPFRVEAQSTHRLSNLRLKLGDSNGEPESTGSYGSGR